MLEAAGLLNCREPSLKALVEENGWWNQLADCLHVTQHRHAASVWSGPHFAWKLQFVSVGNWMQDSQESQVLSLVLSLATRQAKSRFSVFLKNLSVF